MPSGERDRVILPLLISSGLRRAELVRLEVGWIQQCEGRWVIPDPKWEKGTDFPPSPSAAVKVRIDAWTKNTLCLGTCTQ